MAEESIPEMGHKIDGQQAHQNQIPPSLTSAISSSNSLKGGSLSTPVMDPQTQFDSLITPQLPPPPVVTPTQLMNQVVNLDGRRLTSITGQELNDVRKDLATDQKTPPEYTLHILFTQFVRHAERKLNVCLNNYSLETEPPIIELLSEGADKEFDKIIESLGHIARRKPKPVIDSVMFWRKSKSEVSMLAAAAVEKNMKLLKLEQMKLNNNSSQSTALTRSSSTTQQQKLQKKPSVPTKGGLYRQASLSFIRSHNKNNNSKTSLSTEKSSSSSQEVITTSQTETIRSLELKLQESKMTAIQGERKSLISIYILCRVLIEVVRQTPTDVFGDDLGDKLEEIIYSQLKTTDPLLISESVIRSSNWNLFAELIGNMSEKRFLNVSDRFIADLEKVPPKVANGRDNFIIKNDVKIPVASIFSETGDNDFIEESLTLLIHGMRYLKLSHYPLESFEESADFLQSIGKFFSKCERESLIIAYCEVLNQLLLPLAGVITAEVNHPQWREAINIIYEKLLRLLQQEPDKYWDCAINLLTTVLTVSPDEIFLKNWQNLIQVNSVVLRPKVQIEDIVTFITCLTRLTWVYLYRCTESLNTTHRTLDSISNLLFFNQAALKRRWLTTDQSLIEILVYLIRTIGYSSLNFTLENVILPLVKQANNGPGLENILQPQMILAVRAYVGVVKDYELKRRPLFPSDDVIADALQEQYMENVTSSHFFNNKQSVFQKDTSNAALSEDISRVFQNVLSLLDKSVGAPTWQINEESPESSHQSSNGSSTSSLLSFTSKSAFSTFLHGKDVQVVNRKPQNTELFATLVEAAPFIGENINTKKLVEILVRNAAHHDTRISKAAIVSLKTMTVKKNPKILITVFARYAFQLDDNPKQTYSVEFLTSAEYLKLLKLYVELLVCWLNSLRYRLNALQHLKDDVSAPIAGHPLLLTKTNSGIPQLDSDKIGDELELKNIATIIEEVEGNGLFFLCSQDFSIRGLGLQILRIISQFDDVIYDISTIHSNIENSLSVKSSEKDPKKHKRTPSKFVAEFGTRLIQVLENIDFFDVIAPLETDISYPERARLKELKLRRKKNVLIYLAKSDYGIDSTLWFKIFPTILKIIFAKCAIPIALCRSVVCIRLVQMYDIIFDYANGTNFQKNPGKGSGGLGQYHHSSLSTSSFFSSFNSAPVTNNESPGKVVGSQAKLTYKHNSPPELLVEQWRIYLIFATSTLTSTSEQKLHIPSTSISSVNGSGGGFTKSHLRKRSQQVFTVQHQKITSAKSIFKMVLPLLSTQQTIVRDAVVASLSSINVNIFRSFIESILPIMGSWGTSDNQWDDKIRIEIARVLNNITLRFLDNTQAYSDEWILINLVTIIKHLKSFLSTPSVQVNFEFQRLRRYFSGILENVFSAILKSYDSEKWFPFEARVSCFSYLEEWCGYGRTKPATEERYRIINKKASSTKDSISLSATIDLERSALEYSAIRCMANICARPISKVVEEDKKSVTMSFDRQGLLEWIHALFSSQDERILALGKKALLNILTVNEDCGDIYTDIINQCYLNFNNSKTFEGYFITLSQSILKLDHLPITAYQMLTWCFFAVGNDNYNIRIAATKLLKFTEKLLYNTLSVELLSERLCSKSRSVYKSGLFHVAAVFSKDVQTISELTRVFHIVGAESRKDILSALLPFLNAVELKMNEGNLTDEVTQMVLLNLLDITVKYSDTMQNEVEGLWVALANGNNTNNVNPIIYFLTMNCLQRRNTQLVQYARQIVVYLSNTPAGSTLVSEFISNLEPKYMVPPQQTANLEPVNSTQMPYVASIWETLASNGKETIISLGQLSVIFLGDLLISPPEALQKQLPLLLHVSFVLLDHYLPVVLDVACEMLIHLIHNLSNRDTKALDAVELLRKHDVKTLWVYDDLNSDKKGARTPATMDSLIRDVLAVLSPQFPSLQEEWSRVSLSWATTCAVRHIACRSFQVFRSLLSFLDQSMLRDMLHRLSNTISDETPDIQGFAMQILMTLNAVTAELDALQLIDFPQLFWSSVACLSSVHEQEYIEVLSTLSKFVSKIDLDSELTVSCLTSTFPPKWEGKFDGLQQIVMIGLRSSNSWEHSLRLLDRLNKLHDSQIIGSGDSRLLLALLSNLPRYLHALEINEYPDDVIDSAETICEMVNRLDISENGANDRSALKRILESFIKKRFRTKQDFLNETINKIFKCFFPVYEAQTLVFLLGILSNSIKWVKIEAMELLEKIFPGVHLQREEFIGVGADLISPLLRLLLTDYAEKALKVLDEAVSISGSQLDKDVLRMSLGNKTIRKEYEKTATLFGIPDESGWAIPMPAVTAATTRNNVHSVFSTCTTATNNAETELQTTTTNVEFHKEEYSHVAGAGEFGDSISVVDSHNQYHVQEQDPSLSHIYAALVNLDSFFGDEDEKAAIPHSGNSHQYNSSIDTKESTAEPIIPFESAPQVYDKKVSAILNRSLARTPSNTSFKTSLADSFGSSPTMISEQHLHRDHSSQNVSQRTSYMSFRSNRSSSRRPGVELSSSSLMTGSLTDITKSEERSPHRISPLVSQPSRYIDSPFVFSDFSTQPHQQQISLQQLQPQLSSQRNQSQQYLTSKSTQNTPQQSHSQQQQQQSENQNVESSFRFEGILRSSNKNRRRSAKTHNNNTVSSPITNSGGVIAPDGTIQSNGTPTIAQSPIVNGSTPKNSNRSSVFSRTSKKNSPKFAVNRDIQ